MNAKNHTEIQDKLKQLHTWELHEDKITKIFAFKTYAMSVLFVNACAYLAESHDHHPDLKLTYGKVKVSLSTHSAGGVTDKDINMALAIDALAASAMEK